MALTRHERAALMALRRLGARWPESLFLFVNNGSLELRRYGEQGICDSRLVEAFDIECDAGDPTGAEFMLDETPYEDGEGSDG